MRPLGDLALVTVGAGFIGRHLVRALLTVGWRVRAFDNLSKATTGGPPTDERFEIVEMELTGV